MNHKRLEKGLTILGQTFNSWTVLSYVGQRGKGKNYFYLCKCICGQTSEVSGSNLRTGKSTKCKSCATKINGKKGIYKRSKKHLYCIRCGDFIKIGSSDNPKRRINDIKSDNPGHIKVIWIKENEGYLEESYHIKYSNHHYRGEWFYIPEESCELS